MSNQNQGRTADIFDDIAKVYDDNATVQKEVANRLIERLDFIRCDAKVILDAGCGTGTAMKRLAKHFPKASLTGIDLSEEMLKIAKKQSGWFGKQKFSGQDMCHSLVEDNSVDFIFSNLALPWVTDIKACFSEWQRILKPGGLLLFSTFGPDTLKEVKLNWATINPKQKMMRFIDMHDIGDALLASRLAEPVMDAENITTNYTDIKQLFDELKANGNFGFLSENFRLSPDAKLIEKLDESFAEDTAEDGVPVTWEVIYGHAWGTDIKQAEMLDDETFIIDAGLK